MAIFMDVEVVSVEVAEPPDAFSVAFDTIYAGETWCRSMVWVETAVAAGLEGDERAVVGKARDALVDALMKESVPVSFYLRLTTGGTTVLARATPGGC